MIVSVAFGDTTGAPSTVPTQATFVLLCSGVTVMDSVFTIVPFSLGKLNEGFRSTEKTKNSDPFINQSTLAPESRRHLKVATVSIGYIKVAFTGYSANAIYNVKIIITTYKINACTCHTY